MNFWKCRYAANKSMDGCAFCNADGDFLIVPQQGSKLPFKFLRFSLFLYDAQFFTYWVIFDMNSEGPKFIILPSKTWTLHSVHILWNISSSMLVAWMATGKGGWVSTSWSKRAAIFVLLSVCKRHLFRADSIDYPPFKLKKNKKKKKSGIWLWPIVGGLYLWTN